MACSITDPLGCVSSVAQSTANDAFSSIAHDFGNAADSTINWLWGQLSDATAVHLGGAGFDLDLAIVAAITGVVAVGLFVIQIATSVLRRDPSGLGRAIKGLFVAFLAGGAAVGITNLALAAVDALSAGVVQMAMGTTIDQMGHKLLAGDAILQVGNPAGMFLLSIVAIIATVIVWVALLVRKALIVVSAVFAPLAFAGSLADITVGWTRKWIELMVALVVSKLILVLIFIIGWGIIDGAGQATSGTTQTITQTATGLLILALAGFAPWMALKLVHFSEDQFHRVHSLATSTTSGARTAAAVPQKVAAWTSTAASFGATAGAGAASGSGSSAATGAGGPKGGPPGSPAPSSQGRAGETNGKSEPPAGNGSGSPHTPSGNGTKPPPASPSTKPQEPVGAAGGRP